MAGIIPISPNAIRNSSQNVSPLLANNIFVTSLILLYLNSRDKSTAYFVRLYANAVIFTKLHICYIYQYNTYLHIYFINTDICKRSRRIKQRDLSNFDFIRRNDLIPVGYCRSASVYADCFPPFFFLTTITATTAAAARITTGMIIPSTKPTLDPDLTSTSNTLLIPS